MKQERQPLYVTYQDVHRLIKKLAGQVNASGFVPDVIVAIGSGGFIPARILKSFVNRPIYAVGISYYGVADQHRNKPSKIQWIDEVRQNLHDKKILLIDEVDDSRATLGYCIGELLEYNPKEIAVLVLHNKEKQKDVEFPAEITRYFAGAQVEDIWIKYPWDAMDIDEHDALAHSQTTRHDAKATSTQGATR
ncbi:phosphoribosyltransferase [Parasphaerochaeta coccoides]|uniref:Phosphoribosyltransferase n=1 Tax=Parasphaerochaeta coccoides (strain ATCC BAA-1237 / DSM 17374 / SPN1) TaxID=760011 RepID=F4GM28_PARC1|nr:phosphoribosyltransferase [Parasphaerochaeta coccoides]AEC02503.1 phosphoribosyltransferase [Parasphaerochaeta coccoides DSM 17374]